MNQTDIMIKDVRCRQNISKPITRKQCKNNCQQWDYIKQKCKLNYNPKAMFKDYSTKKEGQ